MTNERLPFPTRLWFCWVCLVRVLFDGAFAARVWRARAPEPALPKGQTTSTLLEAPSAAEARAPEAEKAAEAGPAPAAKEGAEGEAEGAPKRAAESAAEGAPKQVASEAEGAPKQGAEGAAEGAPKRAAESEVEAASKQAAESAAEAARKRAAESELEAASKPAAESEDAARERAAESEAEGVPKPAAAPEAAPAKPTAAVPVEPPSEQVAPPLPKEPELTAALQLLGLFQREGRFIDFLEQDIAAFSDADVGAAARVIHEGCRRALHAHAKLAPVRSEPENEPIDLPEGFRAAEIKLSGDVRGSAPYHGTLRHRGWRVTEFELPTPLADHDPQILAPAEVEL